MAEAVVSNQHSTSYPNARGLNIEIDKQASFANIPNMEGEDVNRLSFDKYGNTKFAKETRWDEMLKKVR